MRVVEKLPGEWPVLAEWDKIGWEEINGFVGGIICTALWIRLPEANIVAYCHDEGLLLGMPLNFYRPTDLAPIVGPVLFCGSTDDGHDRSLTDHEIEWLQNDKRSPIFAQKIMEKEHA